jgi:MYXO-CTERM domain-containing protein
MKTFLVLSVAGALVATAAATADVQSIEIESLGDTGNGITYHMYAVVDEGSRVDAVFGNSSGTATIGAADGLSFYQNLYGGPLSTQCNTAFFALAPSLQYDSFVTIGALDSSGNPFDNNALLDIGIDWAGFNAGGSFSTDNGSWFITPLDDQGEAINGRVLIGQFTVIGGTGDGYADLVGMVNIQGSDASGETYQTYGLNIGGWVPAPGALALLGVAGLAGRRRRR